MGPESPVFNRARRFGRFFLTVASLSAKIRSTVMNDMIYWFHRAGIAPRTLTAQYVELVKIFVKAGVRFQVSSDDHRTGLGNTRWSQIVLSRAGVPRNQIVDPLAIKPR